MLRNKGGVIQTLRWILFWLLILSVAFTLQIILQKKHNYSDLHRRVNRIESRINFLENSLNELLKILLKVK